MKLLPDLGPGRGRGKNCCIINEAHSESCCGQKSRLSGEKS